MASSDTARDSGVQFLKSVLRKDDYDFSKLRKELESVTRHVKEEYRSVRVSDSYSRKAWDHFLHMEYDQWVDAKYEDRWVKGTYSIDLDKLLSRDMCRIVDVLVKDGKLQGNQEKYGLLKSKVDPENPQSLREFQGFVALMEATGLAQADFKNFSASKREETVMKVGQDILKGKGDKLSDAISRLVLIKDVKEFFGVNLMPAREIEKTHEGLRESITACLKGDPKHKPDGDMTEAFSGARERIKKFDKVRGETASEGLVVDEERAKKTRSDMVAKLAGDVYESVLKQNGLRPVPA